MIYPRNSASCRGFANSVGAMADGEELSIGPQPTYGFGGSRRRRGYIRQTGGRPRGKSASAGASNPCDWGPLWSLAAVGRWQRSRWLEINTNWHLWVLSALVRVYAFVQLPMSDSKLAKFPVAAGTMCVRRQHNDSTRGPRPGAACLFVYLSCGEVS